LEYTFQDFAANPWFHSITIFEEIKEDPHGREEKGTIKREKEKIRKQK